jgi:hypothetical protein
MISSEWSGGGHPRSEERPEVVGVAGDDAVVVVDQEGRVGVDHVGRAAGGAERSDGPPVAGMEGVFGRAGQETGEDRLAGAVPPGLGRAPGGTRLWYYWGLAAALERLLPGPLAADRDAPCATSAGSTGHCAAGRTCPGLMRVSVVPPHRTVAGDDGAAPDPGCASTARLS